MALSLIDSFITTALGGDSEHHDPASPGVGEFHDLTRCCSEKTKRQFANVFARLRLENAPALALSLRLDLTSDTNATSSHRQTSEITCRVIQPPFNGVYNLVYCLEFSDGKKWALKVPRRGYPGDWTEVCARVSMSEARIMQLLKRETTIPVPEVYALDVTFNNELACPFLLMEFLEGTSLDQFWDIQAPHPEKLNLQQRVQLLQDLASVVTQLEKFQFDQCGTPLLNEDAEVVGVGPAIFKDRRIDEGDHAPPLIEAGPFNDGISFLTWNVDRFVAQSKDLSDGEDQALFHRFLSWMHDSVSKPERFILAHRDLGPQNILISKNGRLCGIIDWDMAAALPRYLSNGRGGSYPHWLTRDIDLWGGIPCEGLPRATIVQGLTSMSGNEEESECEDDKDRHATGDSENGQSQEEKQKDKLCDIQIDSEEQDFYRAVWRGCLDSALGAHKAGNSTSSNDQTDDDILAVIPRTYAEGLRPVQIDGRLFLKAADYPHMKLNKMMSSIHERIIRLKEDQPWLLSSPRSYQAVRSRNSTLSTLNPFDGCANVLESEQLLSSLQAVGASENVRLLPKLSDLTIEQLGAVTLSSSTPPYSYEEEDSFGPGILYDQVLELTDLTPPKSPEPQFPSDSYDFRDAVRHVPDDLPLFAGIPTCLPGTRRRFSDGGAPFGIEDQLGAASPSIPHRDQARPAQNKQKIGVEIIGDGLHDPTIEELKPWFIYLYASNIANFDAQSE